MAVMVTTGFGNEFTGGEKPSALQWNDRTQNEAYAEMVKRCSLISTLFAVPTISYGSAFINISNIDGMLNGVRLTGDIERACVNGAKVYLHLNMNGDPSEASAPQAGKLVVCVYSFVSGVFTLLPSPTPTRFAVAANETSLGDRASGGDVILWFENSDTTVENTRAGIKRSTDGALYYTVDDGATWTLFGATPPIPYRPFSWRGAIGDAGYLYHGGIAARNRDAHTPVTFANGAINWGGVTDFLLPIEIFLCYTDTVLLAAFQQNGDGVLKNVVDGTDLPAESLRVAHITLTETFTVATCVNPDDILLTTGGGAVDHKIIISDDDTLPGTGSEKLVGSDTVHVAVIDNPEHTGGQLMQFTAGAYVGTGGPANPAPFVGEFWFDDDAPEPDPPTGDHLVITSTLDLVPGGLALKLTQGAGISIQEIDDPEGPAGAKTMLVTYRGGHVGTRNPGATDDHTQGCFFGGLWFNTADTPQTSVWACQSAAEGAALWVRIDPGLIDGGTY